MTVTIRRLHLAIAVLVVALIAPATAVATHIFTDVPDGAFYADPVEWAFNNQITTGKSSTKFAPLDAVTRGESVTFLQRYDQNIVQPALGDRYTKAEVDALVAAAVSAKLDKSDIKWASIAEDGSIINGSGTTGSSKPSSALYYVLFDRDITTCSAFGTPSEADGGRVVAREVVVNQLNSDPTGLYVVTLDSTGTPITSAFSLLVIC